MKFYFEASHSFVSEAIKFVTKSDTSHAVPVLAYDNGTEYGLSADIVLVNLIDMNTYRVKEKMFRAYEIPDAKPLDEVAKKVLKKYNQKPYGYLSLGWFVFPRAIIRLFSKDWSGSNWIKWGGICSEVTAYAYLQMYGQFPEEYRYLEKDVNAIDQWQMELIVKATPGVRLVETWVGSEFAKKEEEKKNKKPDEQIGAGPAEG